jgi:hypothetical protein
MDAERESDSGDKALDPVAGNHGPIFLHSQEQEHQTAIDRLRGCTVIRIGSNSRLSISAADVGGALRDNDTRKEAVKVDMMKK